MNSKLDKVEQILASTASGYQELYLNSLNSTDGYAKEFAFLYQTLTTIQGILSSSKESDNSDCSFSIDMLVTNNYNRGFTASEVTDLVVKGRNLIGWSQPFLPCVYNGQICYIVQKGLVRRLQCGSGVPDYISEPREALLSIGVHEVNQDGYSFTFSKTLLLCGFSATTAASIINGRVTTKGVTEPILRLREELSL